MTEPNPIDPNVKIPPAVKALAARADAAFKRAYAKPDEPAPDATVAGQVENPVDDPTNGKADNISGNKVDDKTDNKIEDAAPPVTPDAKPVTSKSNEDWEHAYRSMKGRYDRAERTIAQMGEQIGNLQNVIASMQVQQTPTPAELRAERLITKEEEDDYGSEFLAVVGKKAKEELSPEVAALRDHIKKLEAKLEGVGGFVALSARDRMIETLDQRLSNWRDINHDERFMSWLQLPDTYSGVIRHDLLKAAFERNDSSRVLAFFQGFLSEEAAVEPAKLDLNPAPQKQVKVPLETFAAPGRAKTAAAHDAPVEKPIISRAQITAFYADVAAGKYRGKDDERKQLENMIFEAQRDGRIR